MRTAIAQTPPPSPGSDPVVNSDGPVEQPRTLRTQTPWGIRREYLDPQSEETLYVAYGPDDEAEGRPPAGRPCLTYPARGPRLAGTAAAGPRCHELRLNKMVSWNMISLVSSMLTIVIGSGHPFTAIIGTLFMTPPMWAAYYYYDKLWDRFRTAGVLSVSMAILRSAIWRLVAILAVAGLTHLAGGDWHTSWLVAIVNGVLLAIAECGFNHFWDCRRRTEMLGQSGEHSTAGHSLRGKAKHAERVQNPSMQSAAQAHVLNRMVAPGENARRVDLFDQVHVADDGRRFAGAQGQSGPATKSNLVKAKRTTKRTCVGSARVLAQLEVRGPNRAGMLEEVIKRIQQQGGRVVHPWSTVVGNEGRINVLYEVDPEDQVRLSNSFRTTKLGMTFDSKLVDCPNPAVVIVVIRDHEEVTAELTTALRKLGCDIVQTMCGFCPQVDEEEELKMHYSFACIVSRRPGISIATMKQYLRPIAFRRRGTLFVDKGCTDFLFGSQDGYFGLE